MSTTMSALVRGTEAQALLQGPLGADLLAGRQRTGGAAAFVVHPLAPRTLGSPLHTHSREDEWSFVLEGEVGVQVGEETLVAHAGDLVLKPRGVPHAFWNATDGPARLLEVITPGGFEDYFAELSAVFAPGGPPDPVALEELASRHGMTVDMGSVPRLSRTHGLAVR